MFMLLPPPPKKGRRPRITEIVAEMLDLRDAAIAEKVALKELLTAHIAKKAKEVDRG